MNRRIVRANLLLTLTALIWGAAFVAQRLGMDHVGPMTFNGIRFAIGGLALLPIAMRSAGAPEEPLPVKKALLAGLAAGIALFLGASFQQIGIIYTTASNAGFITGLYVVIVPFLGLFMGQRIGLGAWLGVTLAVIGMYFLSVTQGLQIGYGDLLVLICAFFFAGHVQVVGYFANRMNALRFSCMQYAVCSLLSIAAAIATEEITMAGIYSGMWPILYGGIMSVGVAYTLQVVGQKDAHPTHAAIILSLEGVFAALCGWIMLGETLGLRELCGCGLMLAGILVSELGDRIREE